MWVSDLGSSLHQQCMLQRTMLGVSYTIVGSVNVLLNHVMQDFLPHLNITRALAISQTFYVL